MNPLEHRQVSNCGITKILPGTVHDRCPFQLANINVNIFVNIRPIVNIVVSWD